MHFVHELRLAARELPDGMNCPGDMNRPAGHGGAIPFMERSEKAFIRSKTDMKNITKFIVPALILTAAAKWSEFVKAAEADAKQRDERKAAEARRREELHAATEKRHKEEQEREERKRLELEQELVEGPWEFEFVLTDEEKRKRILDFVKPYFNEQGRAGASDDYQNLNLAYGVTDKSGTVFVTLTYYMSDSIKRCDDYDDYSYIVLTGKTAFGVDWKDRGRSGCFEKIGPSNIVMPRWAEPFREIVGQALAFYEDLDEERAFEKKLKADDPQFNIDKLYYQVRHEALRPYYNQRPKV